MQRLQLALFLKDGLLLGESHVLLGLVFDVFGALLEVLDAALKDTFLGLTHGELVDPFLQEAVEVADFAVEGILAGLISVLEVFNSLLVLVLLLFGGVFEIFILGEKFLVALLEVVDFVLEQEDLSVR